MTTPATYSGEPTIKSRVISFLQEREGSAFTRQQIASGVGLAADRISSTLYNISSDKNIPVTKEGTADDGLAMYAYHSQPSPPGEIVPTTDGRLRLSVPGEEPEQEDPEPEPEEAPMPIGDKLIIAGNQLENGDIVAADESGNLWRAFRLK